MPSLVFYCRWSLIAGHLPGRTDNEIKNFWNSHLSRRVYSFPRTGGDAEPVREDLSKLAGTGGRQRRGRVSRSAAKTNTMNGIPSREKNDQKGFGLSTSSAETQSDEGLETIRPIESSGLWGANIEMEAMHFGATEESSAGWGSHEEIRETGVLWSSEEREGRAALVLNENGDEEGMRGTGSEEEVGSAHADELLDWDLGGLIEGRLWDEGGEMWPWRRDMM